MAIEDNYNKVVSVNRLADVTGTDKEDYAVHLTGIRCHIQPLDESYSQDVEGNFAKDWLMFCDACDIQEMDIIVDGSDKYLVAGVEKYHYLGADRHMELRIRKSTH